MSSALSAPVGSASAVSGTPGLADPYLTAPYGVIVLVLGAVVLGAALLGAHAWRRVRLAAWLGRLPGRMGALPTEARSSLDRPRGYKVARLVADHGAMTGGFLGLTLGGLYSEDAAASCEVLSGSLPPPRRWGRRSRPQLHGSPDLDCSCGFYAFHDREAATALLSVRPPVSRVFGLVLLEVDLSGTVIEFDRGFRAGHQRVLGVEVPRWCVPCATSGHARRARRIAGLSGRPLEEACYADLPRHPPLYRLAHLMHHRALLERLGEQAALRAVCDEHTPAERPAGTGPVTTLAFELPELAARLGTEVRWLDDEAFDVASFVVAMSWLPPGTSRAA